MIHAKCGRATPKGALHRKGKFTLEWLERPELRRQATAELNKAEARNALASAVCFHRLGRLRDRTIEFAE